MVRKICVVLLILSKIVQESVAQDDELDSLLNEVLFEDRELFSLLHGKEKIQFIYARTNFENKSFFAGRDIGINQSNTTAQVYYFHSIGIYAGIAGVSYSRFDPKIYTTLLSAGYSGKLTKSEDYRFRASFDKYFFRQNDSLQNNYSNSINLGATIDKEIAGSRFDFSILTGKETGFQFSWDFYGDIKIADPGTSGSIKFEPEFSLYFGSEEVIYFEIGKVTGGLPGLRKPVSKLTNKFGLLNREIILPVVFDYKNFDFELGYNINFPKTFQPRTKLPTKSYFNFSVGYIFSLN
jgi:hypothetical protein